MTNFEIRIARADDFDAIADLINATKPNSPVTAQNLRAADARLPDYCMNARWVAEIGSRVVGLGAFNQQPNRYDPVAVEAIVRVHPQCEGRGIGQALYATIEQAALRSGIRILRGGVAENKPRAVDFALRSGYVEHGRLIGSSIELTTFDPVPFNNVIPELAARGIQLRSFAELNEGSGVEQFVYDLFRETVKDIPTALPITVPVFEEFSNQIFTNPAVPHEGIILALANEELVGMTLHRDFNEAQINVDYTGVRRDFRGHGVGLALKVAGLNYAWRRGAHTLLTTNDPTNPAIITLNQRIGFVAQPAWLLILKNVAEK